MAFHCFCIINNVLFKVRKEVQQNPRFSQLDSDVALEWMSSHSFTLN